MRIISQVTHALVARGESGVSRAPSEAIAVLVALIEMKLGASSKSPLVNGNVVFVVSGKVRVYFRSTNISLN